MWKLHLRTAIFDKVANDGSVEEHRVGEMQGGESNVAAVEAHVGDFGADARAQRVRLRIQLQVFDAAQVREERLELVLEHTRGHVGHLNGAQGHDRVSAETTSCTYKRCDDFASLGIVVILCFMKKNILQHKYCYLRIAQTKKLVESSFNARR